MSKTAKTTEAALEAFMRKKAGIDTMITRLQALSDDHFGHSPDEIHWGHVGTLAHYAELKPCWRVRSTRNQRFLCKFQ